MKVFDEFDFEDEEVKPSPTVMQVSAVIDHALSGKHNTWEFIRNLDELKIALTVISATNKLIKGFKKSTRAFYKQYTKKVASNKRDLNDLDTVVALHELTQTVVFYKEEINTVEDMIDEFKAYARCGHLFEIAFGYTRLPEDLYDHRKPRPSSM